MKKIITAIFTLCFIGSVQATEVAVIDFRAALLESKIGQEAAKEPKQKVAEMDAKAAEVEAKAKADALAAEKAVNEARIAAAAPVVEEEVVEEAAPEVEAEASNEEE